MRFSLAGPRARRRTIFDGVRGGTIRHLGSRLFARGALARISTLKFRSVKFDEDSLTDLINGFRQSGHSGSALQTLIFEKCKVGPFYTITTAASLALIAGLGNGIFPNIRQLLMPSGGPLRGQVAELVEVVRVGAPCARTLRTVVMSKHYLCPADIEPLQAALSQASVTLG